MCLREPYLRAVGARGYADRRLAFALGFVEPALCFLTAVLAHEGGRFGDVTEFEALRRDLDRPSLGRWAHAADALARKVLAMPNAVARPAALALRDEKGRPTEGFRGLEALITARNRLAHDSARPLDPTSPAAQRLYVDEVRPALRAFLDALGFVRALPIYAVDAVDPGAGRARRVYRFVGAETEVVELRHHTRVRSLEPLLIGADGTVLELGPFLSVSGDRTGVQPVLLHRVKGKVATFLTPDGHSTKPLPSWLDRWVEGREVARPRADHDPELAAAVYAPSASLRGHQVASRYRVEHFVARGASANVYRAHDPEGRAVALKVLHAPLRHSHAHTGRLRREIEVLCRLEHPGIVTARELCDDPEVGLVLVMEYARGVDLARVFSNAPAPTLVASAIVLQVLDALAHLHRAGVVHRDVKPANVMLHNDRVTLVDFGIARDTLASRLTATLDRLGTRSFAAPEQTAGDPVGPAADLFAVGRVMMWLTTGTPEPDRALGDMSPGLAGWVRRAIRPRPEERFADADEMAAELRALRERGLDLAPPLSTGDELLDESWRVSGPLTLVSPGIWSAPVLETATQDPGTLWCSPLKHSECRRLREAVAARRTGRRVVAAGDAGLYLAVYDADVVLLGLAMAGVDPEPAPAPAQPTADAQAAWLAAHLGALPGIDRVAIENGWTVGYSDLHRNPVAIVGYGEPLDARLALNPFAISALHWMTKHGVGLLGLTDGEQWRWARRTGQRHLAEAYDPKAALAHMLAERARLSRR